MKKIYLLRHARIERNHKMIGRLDVPLSLLGQEQAHKMHIYLKNINFQTCYTSPLARCIQSLEIIIGKNKKYLIEENFIEINLGDWEGKTKNEILANSLELWKKRGEDIANTPCLNGESFVDLQKRVIPAFYKICKEIQKDKPILILAHQAVNRVILAELQNIPLKKVLAIPQEYACINYIELDDNLKLVKYTRLIDE